MLILPACFSLPKLPPGPRYIDDFEEAAGLDGSTWSAFGPWSCRAFTSVDTDGGVTGQPATGPDGGSPVNCTLGPGETGQHSLMATFDLAVPSSGQLTVEVATHAVAGPVDLNGFKQFQFDARLDSIALNSPASLPTGTGLEVELGCSKNTVYYSPDIRLEGNWIPTPFSQPLLMFKDSHSSPSEACLAQVDSVRFVVLFGSTSDLTIAGTLWLDNIALQ